MNDDITMQYHTGRCNTIQYNAMQYKLQYQRDILLSMTQNCAKLHVTHNFLIPFIFISIYDLDLHLYFYDNFQFFLVSLFP
jgi:hypothetical protein